MKGNKDQMLTFRFLLITIVDYLINVILLKTCNLNVLLNFVINYKICK